MSMQPSGPTVATSRPLDRLISVVEIVAFAAFVYGVYCSVVPKLASWQIEQSRWDRQADTLYDQTSQYLKRRCDALGLHPGAIASLGVTTIDLRIDCLDENGIVVKAIQIEKTIPRTTAAGAR